MNSKISSTLQSKTLHIFSTLSNEIYCSRFIRVIILPEKPAIFCSSLFEITAFAKKHEEEFTQVVLNQFEQELSQKQRKDERTLEETKERMKSLDTIIEKLYEDNVFGKISDDRFRKMSAGYEAEQSELKTKMLQLQTELNKARENIINTKHFLQLVKKHTEISTINPELIREFVDKIIVYQAEKVDGKQEQRIKIYYNCIGAIEIESNAEMQTS